MKISLQDYFLLSKNLTYSSTKANNLPQNIFEDSKEPFELLPRIKLVPSAEDEYQEFEYELIDKANYWHIPYDKKNPDFSDLENSISEYKPLVEEALNLGINWDFTVYDPIGLRQAIEDEERREYSYGETLKNDYYFSRRV